MSLTKLNEKKAKAKRIISELKIRDYFREQLYKFIDVIFDYVDVEAILLYGSVARGKGYPLKSDIDIILISSNLPPLGIERTLLRRKVAAKRPKDVEAIWATPEEFDSMYRKRLGFLLDALYEGIIILDEKNFLKKYKSLLQEELSQGKLTRRGAVWVLPSKSVS